MHKNKFLFSGKAYRIVDIAANTRENRRDGGGPYLDGPPPSGWEQYIYDIYCIQWILFPHEVQNGLGGGLHALTGGVDT